MECGVRMAKVDTMAICQGYRLAFPENNDALNEWLVGEDEYAGWSILPSRDCKNV
jgi:hypothetical protein